MRLLRGRDSSARNAAANYHRDIALAAALSRLGLAKQALDRCVARRWWSWWRQAPRGLCGGDNSVRGGAPLAARPCLVAARSACLRTTNLGGARCLLWACLPPCCDCPHGGGAAAAAAAAMRPHREELVAGYGQLEAALELLAGVDGRGGPLAPALQQQIRDALAGLQPEAVLEFLKVGLGTRMGWWCWVEGAVA